MKPESFSTYVAELQEFSSLNKISCGHPHDLLTLPLTLNFSERLRYEFGSMIRSIVYREHEGISIADLQALVACAWGGYERSEAPTDLPADLIEILYRVRSLAPGEPPPLPEDDLPEEDTAFQEQAVLTTSVEPYEIIAEPPQDPGSDDYAQLLSQRVKRSSGSHTAAPPAAATAPDRPREDPWQDDSWLHRKLQFFHAAHPRRMLGEASPPTT